MLFRSNTLNVVRVYVPHRITITKVGIRLSTAFTGGKYAVAIYSSDGNTKHIDTGAQSTTSAGTQVITLGASVTLSPGFYWYAFTVDNTTAGFRAAAHDGSDLALNADTTQTGTAANASSVGVMPSTLGTITGSDTQAIPVTKFQG